MNNAIAKDFGFFSLIKFAFPSMIMMIVMGLYTIIDSMFVSRFVGTNALSAINIVFPIISIVTALALMISTGGSAIIARKMGDGDGEGAKQDFTMLTIIGVIIGICVTILGLIFMEPMIYALGASDVLFDYCREYLTIMILFAPASILQMLFQMFFVTAGKPVLGMALTILAGIANTILDFIFIVPLGMGLTGAAVATGIGYLIPAVVGVGYFLRKKGTLHFTKPKFRLAVLVESCFNGSSEMVGQLSTAVTTYLFNIMMMRTLGEDGVAAITIVLYAQFLMTALFLGFSMGVAPVISYNYGAENIDRLKRLFRTCIIFVVASSVVIYFVATGMASGITTIFSPKGTNVYNLAMDGFQLLPLSFLFAGFNIFASALFTALSNGKVSAVISFLRTFVFIVAGLLIMPYFFEVTGIWLAIPVAELLTLFMAAAFVYKGGKMYYYI